MSEGVVVLIPLRFCEQPLQKEKSLLIKFFDDLGACRFRFQVEVL